jgi:thioesterase III
MKTIVEIKVRGYHIDHFNHVNNARYLEFLEEGRWAYSEKNNLIHLFHKKGISHVTVNININYRKSAFVGQVLRIETAVVRKGRKSVTMQQKILLNDTDTLIADAEVTNVFLNVNTGKVIPVNKELINLWPVLAEAKNQMSK